MMTKTLVEMFGEELGNKLAASQDADGVFRSSKTFEENKIDQNLSKEERVNEAIKIFEDSLEHDNEKNHVYIIL